MIAELSPAAAPAPITPATLKEGFADRADRWPGTLGPLMRDVGNSLRRRDWAAAEALAAGAGRDHPGSWFGPWLQGVVDQARGQLDSAETRLLESLALSPRSHRAVTNLVAVWSRRHDPLTGADRLVALVDADPSFEYPLPIAARTYLEAEISPPGRRRPLAACSPRRPVRLGRTGDVGDALPRPQSAERCAANLRTGPGALPGQSGSSSSRGEEQGSARRPFTPGAISAYETLLAGQPDHHLGAAELAILLVDVRGDATSSQRALALIHGLEELDGPLEPEALGAIGRVSLKVSRDSASAVHALELAVRGAPDDPSLRYYLGLASKLEGKPELALSALRGALQLGRPFPEEAEARRLNARSSRGLADQERGEEGQQCRPVFLAQRGEAVACSGHPVRRARQSQRESSPPGRRAGRRP